MLRLTAGFGAASLGTELGPVEYQLDGFAGHFAIDVGGAAVENLNLHGRFGVVNVSAPTLTIEGEDFATDDDAAMTMMMFGPGITYYIMPANVYLTAVVGFAWAVISYEDPTGDRETGATDPGFALGVDVGWEFWVGRSWGMGPAVRAMMISCPDDTEVEDPPVWRGLALGVLFSGTFQ